MSKTIIEHVLSRLKEIGVTDVFGVPGDFAFPLNDAICLDPQMRWIGCCNELNAAYAADGYARVKGMGAVCTTYGVGELSALAGIAGAYAEHLPLIHLVGMPTQSMQAGRALMHHTLGNGEYDLFHRMTQPVVCASAVMTPQNVFFHTERLIAEAFYHRRPVYMAFPADLAERPALGSPQSPLLPPCSDPDSLAAAADAVVAALDQAKTACVLPGIIVARMGLRAAMQRVINASRLPFATMFMDKSTLDEGHPAYIGMYDGTLMNEGVREFVENCDCVLSVGAMQTDFNSGAVHRPAGSAKSRRCFASFYARRRQKLPERRDGRPLGGIGRAIAEASVESADHRSGRTSHRRRRRSDHRLGALSALGELSAAKRHSRGRNGHGVDGPRLRADAVRGFVPQPDALGFHRLGHARLLRRGRRLAQSPRGARHRRRSASTHGSRDMPIRPARSAADHLRIEQCRLSDRTPVVQGTNNRLQRSGALALHRVAPRLRLRRLVHRGATTCGELDQALAAVSQSDAGAYIEVVTDAYASPPLGIKLRENLWTFYKA